MLNPDLIDRVCDNFNSKSGLGKIEEETKKRERENDWAKMKNKQRRGSEKIIGQKQRRGRAQARLDKPGRK